MSCKPSKMLKLKFRKGRHIMLNKMLTKNLLQIAIALCSIPLQSFASSPEFKAFSRVDNSVFTEVAEVVVAKNLPRRFSQGSFGNCYAMTAGFLLDAANCRSLERLAAQSGTPLKADSCKELPDEFSYSRLDLSRFGRIFSTERLLRKDYGGLAEGGSTAYILATVVGFRLSVMNQECASLDKVLIDFDGNEDVARERRRRWDILRKIYEEYQESSKCTSCQEKILAASKELVLSNFNIKKNDEELLRVFSSKSYDVFLDRLLIPFSCEESRVRMFDASDKALVLFPEQIGVLSNFRDTLSVIRSQLMKNTPIAVDALCLENDLSVDDLQKQYKDHKRLDSVRVSSPRSPCVDMHAVVISGYKRICQKSDKNKCEDALKIENSWGEDWQKKNDDGWVQAKSFLDKTGYLSQQFMWIEDKKEIFIPKSR